MGVTPPASSGGWRRARSGSCGHDHVHRAGGNQAVEEGERGDDGGAAASAGEVATAACRIGVPGELLNRSRLILSHVCGCVWAVALLVVRPAL